MAAPDLSISSMRKEWRVFHLGELRKYDCFDAFKKILNSLSTEGGFNTNAVKREYVSQMGDVNIKGGCDVGGKGIWEVSTFLSILL